MSKPSVINTLAHILLCDFPILQSQTKCSISKSKSDRFCTLGLTVKQQIIVIPMSASIPCIQYNEGTTRPFEGSQRQVERDWRGVIHVRGVTKCSFQSFRFKSVSPSSGQTGGVESGFQGGRRSATPPLRPVLRLKTIS